jgi:hypothetical protein
MIDRKKDELLWGAAWLHKATKNPTYLSYIKVNGQILGADEQDNTFGWDNKHAGARILISKVLLVPKTRGSLPCFHGVGWQERFIWFVLDAQSFLVQKVGALQGYKGHADSFICSMVPGTPTDQTQYTRGGLLFKLSDSNMQYVTSSSFLLLTYAKYLAFSKKTVSCGGATVTPQRLRAIARRQVSHIARPP